MVSCYGLIQWATETCGNLPGLCLIHTVRGSRAILPFMLHGYRIIKAEGALTHGEEAIPTSSLQSSFWYKHLLECPKQKKKKNHHTFFKTAFFSREEKRVFLIDLFIGKHKKYFLISRPTHYDTELHFHCCRTWETFKISPSRLMPDRQSLQSPKMPHSFKQVEYEVSV